MSCVDVTLTRYIDGKDENGESDLEGKDLFERTDGRLMSGFASHIMAQVASDATDIQAFLYKNKVRMIMDVSSASVMSSNDCNLVIDLLRDN